jgi:GNAT superfamily N-acetyltransferase
MNIRQLAPADLDGAFALSSTAGWNQRLADWRMLLELAPTGSFGAVVDGRIVGTAIGIDYGGFAWIAMMLVDPAYRGQGLGARLLEAAMDAVPASQTIRLDATPMGRPLYQRYGFEDETVLSRTVAEPASRPAAERSGDARRRVRRLAAADLESVASVDRRVFGADRSALLDWSRGGAPNYAHFIEADGGTQYCFGRTGRLFDQIGPVVAQDPDDAAALVEAALLYTDRKAVVADVFDSQDRFVAWLQSRGFVSQRPLFRMCRPGSRPFQSGSQDDDGLVEYAIFGPEFA